MQNLKMDERENLSSDRRAALTDIVNCYTLFLGREPENTVIIQDKVGQGADQTISQFVGSKEFLDEVVPALRGGQGAEGVRFRNPPGLSLRYWIGDFAHLSAPGAELILALSTWPSLLAGVFGDASFQGRFVDQALLFQNLNEELSSIVDQHDRAPFYNFDDISGFHHPPTVLAEWRRLVNATGLFDADYYKQTNPALPKNADPLDHYLRKGFRTYLSPGQDFDEINFLALQVDARREIKPCLVQYALLSVEDRADFRIRETAAIERDGLVGWVEPDLPLPDSDIHVVRLRGVSFFEKFGFSFEGDVSLKHALASIEALASMAPKVNLLDGQRPIVSIIVPIYGQLQFVLNCIDSLAHQICSHSFEILVYDDCSVDDNISGLIAMIPWVNYVRGEENLGFLRACNAAANFCCGKYLVFLNSDVRVAPTWLQELIDTFAAKPLAGFVGSKLFNADGTLQEAGAIVWPDASGHNFGRDDDPNRPQYCYARQVDYCSGAAIALPRAVWSNLGGFDDRFAPAYYEDTDLAFRIRKAGMQVWYQPLARVVHYEGRTNGRDLKRGVKSHQLINQNVFKATWPLTLSTQPRQNTPILEAADGITQKRILILDANIPEPDKDAGSIVVVQLIEAFQTLGWSVSFAALHNLKYNRDYSARLQRLGVEMLHSPYIYCAGDIIAHRDQAYDVVLGCRYNVLYPVYEDLRQNLPLARIIFHNIDLHYLRMEREAALKTDRRMSSRAELVHDEESFLISKADCSLVTSNAEDHIIRQEISDARLVTYAYTMGVQKALRPRAERFNILFFGGYRHTPNVDAAEILARDIWPLLENNLPSEANLVLAGSEMPERIYHLAGGRIKTLGFVPDLRETIESARVFVAPLRYGAGVKGKVVLAMANGLPSVCSHIAVEGMNLEDGRETLVADSAEDFASAIKSIYHDDTLWSTIQAGGYHVIEQRYSQEICLEKCREVLAKADAHWLDTRQRKRKAMLDRLRQI